MVLLVRKGYISAKEAWRCSVHGQQSSSLGISPGQATQPMPKRTCKDPKVVKNRLGSCKGTGKRRYRLGVRCGQASGVRTKANE